MSETTTAPELSKEELENLSWNFLDNITEQMDKLPEAQKAATALGKTLSAAGLIYEHVVDKVRIKAQLQELQAQQAQQTTQARGK